jgi:hypothetical protein
MIGVDFLVGVSLEVGKHDALNSLPFPLTSNIEA